MELDEWMCIGEEWLLRRVSKKEEVFSTGWYEVGGEIVSPLGGDGFEERMTQSGWEIPFEIGQSRYPEGPKVAVVKASACEVKEGVTLLREGERTMIGKVWLIKAEQQTAEMQMSSSDEESEKTSKKTDTRQLFFRVEVVGERKKVR